MADAPSGCSPAFLDHLRAPRVRGVGTLDAPTHRADAEDAVCGDRLALDLRVVEGRVVEVRHRAEGCHGAVAVGSALAILLPGREARPDAVSAADLEAALGGACPARSGTRCAAGDRRVARRAARPPCGGR